MLNLLLDMTECEIPLRYPVGTELREWAEVGMEIQVPEGLTYSPEN